MNCVKNFLSVDWDLFWGINTESDFVAADFNDYNGDVVIDDNAFVLFPGKD